MKKCYFAGGCFWCISGPFYELKSVLKVESGFSGGKEENPTYKEVKEGKTHHRETICISYDEDKISLETLVDIYLMNVDPFDKDGQFIDRGHNYTLALYYLDEDEKNLYLNKIKELEEKSKKKAYIDVEPFDKFYLAEDEHQDFALRNRDKYLEELVISGRIKK